MFIRLFMYLYMLILVDTPRKLLTLHIGRAIGLSNAYM